MINDKIDWTQNCLTEGIHNGRDGTIWSIPLGYAVIIFDKEPLRKLVIERIYSDAMQYVEHGEGFTQEWADAVRQKAEELYPNVLQVTVGQLRRYYENLSWWREQEMVVERVKENKLNKNYEPLHSHDTINLLCRMIGVSAKHIKSIETPN